jgi:hypothetical protein
LSSGGVCVCASACVEAPVGVRHHNHPFARDGASVRDGDGGGVSDTMIHEVPEAFTT